MTRSQGSPFDPLEPDWVTALHQRLACLPARIVALDVADQAGGLIAIDGLELVFWNGRKLPDRHDEVGFVVPPDLFRRPELLPEFGALKVVQTVSAGVDRVVPHLPSGVTLCNANGVHGGSVAEWVMAAVLGILREIPAFASEQTRGDWNTRTTSERCRYRCAARCAANWTSPSCSGGCQASHW